MSNIANIKLWSNHVWPESGGWQPSSDTLAYYPLTSVSTINDQSWNNKNLTKWTVTFWNYKWVDCAYFSWSSSWLRCQSFYSNKRAQTISAWFYWIANWHTWNWNYDEILIWWNNSWIYVDRYGSPYNRLVPQYSTGRKNLTSDSWWNHIVMTYDWNTTWNAFFNWQSLWQLTNMSIPEWTNLSIWTNQSQFNNEYKKWIWWISQVIIEWKVWADTEILNYYNQTKSNYWL